MFAPVTSPLLSDNTRSGSEAGDARSLDLSVYHTLAELRNTLQHLTAHQVVIVLDERFDGYAPSLLKRGQCGGKLTLVALGAVLAEMSRRAIRSLAWDEIVVRREACTAVAESLQHLSPGERLLVLWPAWRSPNELAA